MHGRLYPGAGLVRVNRSYGGKPWQRWQRVHGWLWNDIQNNRSRVPTTLYAFDYAMDTSRSAALLQATTTLWDNAQGGTDVPPNLERAAARCWKIDTE